MGACGLLVETCKVSAIVRLDYQEILKPMMVRRVFYRSDRFRIEAAFSPARETGAAKLVCRSNRYRQSRARDLEQGRDQQFAARAAAPQIMSGSCDRQDRVLSGMSGVGGAQFGD